MLSRVPIRIRLALGHALWMVLIFVATGIGVSKVVGDSVLQSLDATLLTSAKTLRDAQLNHQQKLSVFHDPLYWEAMIDEFFGGRRFVKTYAQLIDTSGKVRAKTNNVRVNLVVSPTAMSRAEKGQETFESYRVSSGASIRQLTLPVMRQGKFAGELIQVAASMSASYNTISNAQMMLWITLSIGFGVSLVFGYLLTSWSLKPVTRITREVASLGFTDNLDRRLKLPEADDELRLLVKTFNEMLGRIEDAFSRLGRFAGDVSHELRTPIAVMRGEAELALRRERTAGEYQDSLKSIVHEAAQMSKIVEALLLLARAQGDAIKVQWEDVNIEDFFCEVAQAVDKAFAAKQVHLKVETGIYSKRTARMASGYMNIVMKNILLNACKHSAAGQVVEFRVFEADNHWLFQVQDYGEGIAKDVMPYVFDLFYRADTARNRSSGGFGIGLSLAKALVTLHGGRIEVKSEPKQGAVFTVFLPHKIDDNEQVIAGKKQKKSNGHHFFGEFLSTKILKSHDSKRSSPRR